MMTPPIRPGTAARLGLRPPKPRSIAMLMLGGSMSVTELAARQQLWVARYGSNPRVEVLRDPPKDASWVRFEVLGERPVRRPWWKRWSA